MRYFEMELQNLIRNLDEIDERLASEGYGNNPVGESRIKDARLRLETSLSLFGKAVNDSKYYGDEASRYIYEIAYWMDKGKEQQP